MELVTASGSPRCCPERWVSILPAQFLSNPQLRALGIDGPPWPEVLAVCRAHLRALRRADGIILGYKMRSGKVRAFVQDELF